MLHHNILERDTHTHTQRERERERERKRDCVEVFRYPIITECVCIRFVIYRYQDCFSKERSVLDAIML